ncbi:hypothetical protein LOK49_LG05G01821 [Camellia lanceoleosa]|uniref:Uncharacterized protein n=1 Tax=Camellia lanceoleosa TaxID=1840588 RepID=A0ACC0HTW8_9ERIC|nr:hypothetical protein LOK49_LG05G01821 [Camellia lanceoleosa]
MLTGSSKTAKQASKPSSSAADPPPFKSYIPPKKNAVFQYPFGAHNVFMVNATGFQNCTPSNLAFTTGNDKIILGTSGEKWYIFGVGEHCAVGGQKLFINVFDDRPCSTSSTSGVTGNAFHLVMLLVVAIFVTVLGDCF